MSQIQEAKGVVYLLDDPDKLIPNDRNSSDRNSRKDSDLSSLMRSIEKYGVRFPILCEKSDDPDRPFKIRDGGRRALALTKLKEKGIEVQFQIILAADEDEVSSDVDMAIAGMQRKALNAMEESDLFTLLLDSKEFKTQAQVGQLVGYSGELVGQRLKLQGLSDKCQKALRVDKLTIDLAMRIVRNSDDHDKQDRRLEKVLKLAETKVEAEKSVEAATKGKKGAKQEATKTKRKASKKATAVAGGPSTRPSKRELTNLAALYEQKWGKDEELSGLVEILSASLRFAAGVIPEEDLFKFFGSFIEGRKQPWSKIKEQIETQQAADQEAEKQEARDVKAKANGKSNGRTKAKAKAPARPSKPKAKAKAKPKAKAKRKKRVKAKRPTASA